MAVKTGHFRHKGRRILDVSENRFDRRLLTISGTEHTTKEGCFRRLETTKILITILEIHNEKKEGLENLTPIGNI